MRKRHDRIGCCACSITILPDKEAKISLDSFLEMFNYDKDIEELLGVKLHKELDYSSDNLFIMSHVIYKNNNQHNLKI